MTITTSKKSFFGVGYPCNKLRAAAATTKETYYVGIPCRFRRHVYASLSSWAAVEIVL